MCVIIAQLLFPQTLKTLAIEFRHEYSEGGSIEAVKGTVYYLAPTKVILKVTSPINQWMVLKGKEMTIYYPDENMGFYIVSQSPISLPFFEAFIGAIKEDYGLTDIGYTLSNHEIRGDTLFTYWSPPKKLSKVLRKLTLVHISNKLTYTELKGTDGTIISKSFYSDHIRYGAIYFPLKITTIRYIKTDSIIEKVVYSNPQFNISLPQEITNFKIPLDAEVKEIKW